MSNVAGIFNTQAEASFAYAALIRDGFSKDNISFLVADSAKASFFGNAAPTSQLYDEGTGGALAGAGFGALMAGLAGVGALIIPGVNLLAVGPLAAAIIGAETGGIVGGLSGLIDADLQADKQKYDDAIKQGKAVLIVNTNSEGERAIAQSVFRDYANARYAA